MNTRKHCWDHTSYFTLVNSSHSWALFWTSSHCGAIPIHAESTRAAYWALSCWSLPSWDLGCYGIVLHFHYVYLSSPALCFSFSWWSSIYDCFVQHGYWTQLGHCPNKPHHYSKIKHTKGEELRYNAWHLCCNKQYLMRIHYHSLD